LAQIEQALVEQTPKILELAAHVLKGELAYLGVLEACDTARQMEEMGKKEQLGHATELRTLLTSIIG